MNTFRAAGHVPIDGVGALSWSAVAGIAAAMLIGAFIVLGVGFAGAEAMHVAAHDMRHGLSFPCH